MKIFLDTNIWLRLFITDNPSQHTAVKAILERIQIGELRPYTSSIVFSEICYVLKNIYKFEQKEILEIFDAIKSIRNITILEKTDLTKTLNFYKKYKVKFGDCLIASQADKAEALISFNQDFKKFTELSWLTPEKLLDSLS